MLWIGLALLIGIGCAAGWWFLYANRFERQQRRAERRRVSERDDD